MLIERNRSLLWSDRIGKAYIYYACLYWTQHLLASQKSWTEVLCFLHEATANTCCQTYTVVGNDLEEKQEVCRTNVRTWWLDQASGTKGSEPGLLGVYCQSHKHQEQSAFWNIISYCLLFIFPWLMSVSEQRRRQNLSCTNETSVALICRLERF